MSLWEKYKLEFVQLIHYMTNYYSECINWTLNKSTNGTCYVILINYNNLLCLYILQRCLSQISCFIPLHSAAELQVRYYIRYNNTVSGLQCERPFNLQHWRHHLHQCYHELHDCWYWHLSCRHSKQGAKLQWGMHQWSHNRCQQSNVRLYLNFYLSLKGCRSAPMSAGTTEKLKPPWLRLMSGLPMRLASQSWGAGPSNTGYRT